MARPAKLGKKKQGNNTYYYTQAGGKGTYFGNVKETTYKEALAKFHDHIQKAADAPKPPKNGVTVSELIGKYLVWLAANKSEMHTKSQRSCLNIFRRHRIGGHKIGDMPAINIDDADLRKYRDDTATTQTNRGTLPSQRTVTHRVKSVKSAWSWARGPESGHLLPKSHYPFTHVSATFEVKRITEADLITDDEIKALHEWAEWDDAESHRVGRWVGFSDLLRCYEGTGARTGELAKAQVKDFSSKSETITLTEHKRDKTHGLRVIHLYGEALQIVKKHCRGKDPGQHIFERDGIIWNTDSVTARFREVREKAEVRDHITSYSFRHLWISKALRAGIPAVKVAELAGTSLREIDRTYGHFWQEDLHDELKKLA